MSYVRKSVKTFQNLAKQIKQDMYASNDPLGQTHSPAGSDHDSRLKLFCFARFSKVVTDGRTTCVKTMIITCRDSGSAEWITDDTFFLCGSV